MSAINALSTANSLLRTLLGLIVVGVISVASWFGYSKINADKQLDDVRKQLKDVNAELKLKTDEIDELNVALAASHRKIEHGKQHEVQRRTIFRRSPRSIDPTAHRIHRRPARF